MKYILYAFFLPMGIFWGWYALSINDINFGFMLLTPDMNHLLFQIYGDILGIDPQIIPGLVARACVFDGFLLLAIYAFRRRRDITAWYRSRRERYDGGASSAPNV